MTTIKLVHAHFDPDRLADVKTEMQRLGPPTIKAVWMECHNVWAALEGCHRLRAAADLGLTPVIDEVDYDEEMTLADIGIDDDCRDRTIAEIADDVAHAVLLDFAE